MKIEQKGHQGARGESDDQAPSANTGEAEKAAERPETVHRPIPTVVRRRRLHQKDGPDWSAWSGVRGKLTPPIVEATGTARWLRDLERVVERRLRPVEARLGERRHPEEEQEERVARTRGASSRICVRSSFFRFL